MSSTKSKTAIIPAEIVPRNRDRVADEYRQMIARIVEEKVSEAMSHESDSIFQPWFQPRDISNEIRRRQTVTEQQKYSNYFADYGCFVCETKDVEYRSLGLCNRCYAVRSERMIASMRRHAPAPDQPQPTFMDTVKLARAALAPSVAILGPKARRASQAEPLSPQQEQSEHPRYRTQTEAAREADINMTTLQKWLALGRIQRPAKKLSPTRWLWSDEDIAKLKALKKPRNGRAL